ncbi:MAG: DNA primase [Vicinamibacteria bacterium]|nr:DNA primase [Vicinamibacteria bacterium]
MAYPDGFVEEVRRTADIVRYIAEHVALKKAGSSWKGLCPFHQEKTPSFNVRADPPAFHCFGCGEGGDIFRFVMLHERVSFPEAVAQVARRFGVAVPRSGGEEERRSGRRQALLAALEAAASHFTKNLWRSSGSVAREYLLGRGFKKETLERIRAGAASSAWDDLLGHIGRRFPTDLLKAAGLVLERQDKRGHYDRFRNRAVFPILDEGGRVVGFGARSLDGSEPKYLNTPETDVYQKARLLYGLSWAKEAFRKGGRAVIMEGYLDVARAIELGVAETVATCGTALSSHHARLLRRFVNRVIVNFDQDDAGQNATSRSIDTLIAEGLDVRVAELPAGHDPDTYLRSEGVDAYRSSLESAPPYMEWLMKRAAGENDVRTPAGKKAFVNAVLPALARIESPVERAAWLPVLAGHGRLDETAMVEELRLALAARSGRLDSEGAPVARYPQLRDFLPVERLLLARLLKQGEGVDDALRQIVEEDIEGLPAAAILVAARRLLLQGMKPSLASLSEIVCDDDRRRLHALALEESPASEQSAMECVLELSRRALSRRLAEVQRKIDQAPESDIEALLRAKQDLMRRLVEP